jgi:hypothetical protein
MVAIAVALLLLLLLLLYDRRCALCRYQVGLLVPALSLGQSSPETVILLDVTFDCSISNIAPSSPFYINQSVVTLRLDTVITIGARSAINIATAYSLVATTHGWLGKRPCYELVFRHQQNFSASYWSQY